MTAESSIMGKTVSSSKSKFPKFRVNLPFFKKTSQVQNNDTQPEAKTSQVQNNDTRPKAETPLTFKQNLKEHLFAAAGKQLLTQEERLFSVKPDGVGSNKHLVEEEEDEGQYLKKDYEDLLNEVWLTVENSFKVQTEEEKKALKQAVLLIQQEEEQDRRWESVAENERPPWRPRCCKQKHDSLLKNMVKQRMEQTELKSSISMNSSIQKEITGKGKQIKEDLLHIAKHVRICYPGENVCHLYAKLYHHIFSAKLREIAEYGLGDEDCLHVLQWVHKHYPSVLTDKELTGVIEYEQLKALLPDNMLEPLKEQFLSQKENELQKWCQNILIEEKTDPELRDGCYFSPLAIDMIECVHGALKSVQEVLGSYSNPQWITDHIQKFLKDYQAFLQNITENNKVNSDAVLKANLRCIRQFREYITSHQPLFSAQTKTECMNLLSNIREICHDHFIKSVHKELKGTYAKFGTREWLKHNEVVCDELLDVLNIHIQKLTYLDKACLKELLSQLHKEVLVEYVRKMMKKKIKLGDEKKQEQAAKALLDNNQKIHTLFTEAGSKLDDLKDILTKLAELLTIKDPQFIELELVGLSKIYPDFSEAHVCAWLYFKGNLSTSDLKNIKKTFADFQEPNTPTTETDSQDPDPIYSSRNFFSTVLVR